MLEAFYADIQNTRIIGIPKLARLKSSRINTDTLYTRGFFVSCDLYPDHVRIDIDTAWAPLTEVWDLMAEKYELVYVYIAEESGCGVYVNTDATRRFFSTRYKLFSILTNPIFGKVKKNSEKVKIVEKRIPKCESNLK